MILWRNGAHTALEFMITLCIEDISHGFNTRSTDSHFWTDGSWDFT